MVDLNKKRIINSLKGHQNVVRTIIKINIPEYGLCLISQGENLDNIKLWTLK